MPTIILESLGPFASRYEIEVKPLTLFIGRNSTGKSVVAHLIWALATATPDFDTLFRVFDKEGGRRYALEILKSLEERKPLKAREALEGALLLLVRRALPQALAQSLKELLPKVYGRRLGRLVTQGHKRALVDVRGRLGEGFRFIIDAENETVSAEAVEYIIVGTMEIFVDVDEEKGVLIVDEETWSAEKIRTIPTCTASFSHY